MTVDWGSLLIVAAVSAGVAVVVVSLVAVALVGLSARARQPATGAAPRRAGSGVAVAVVCLVAALALVSYGLYLIAV